MKQTSQLILATAILILAACTNLERNLHDLSRFQMAGGSQVSPRQGKIGLVVANRIQWEGDDYKFRELDQKMENELALQLRRSGVDAVPYTGAEAVDHLIEVDVLQDFDFLEIGGNAATDILAIALSEYASLGFYCALKLRLETTASGRGKSLVDTAYPVTQARENRSVVKNAGANAWSTTFAGNYGINSTLVTMLSGNSGAVTAAVARLVNSLPEQPKPTSSLAQARPKPAVRPYRRSTDQLPDFGTLRPHG